MLKVSTIPVTPFMQNARVLACSESNHCVVVDPGGDTDLIIKAVRDGGLDCKAVWLTHSHLDHAAGVRAIIDEFKVPLYAHPNEELFRKRLPEIAAMYGLSQDEWPVCPEPDLPIVGGEVLWLGSLRVETIFTPGHSPGHISFYLPSEATIISGDAIFKGSIGRTDLPGGDHNLLISSIRDKLLTLPDKTRVLSGHGDDTDIGRERRENPFLV